jgi:hypothetical protein
MSFYWSALVLLPPTKRAGVNAERFRQFLLGYAKKATIADYPLPNAFSINYSRAEYFQQALDWLLPTNTD